MRVELVCKAIVPDIVRAVASLGHSTQGKVLHRLVLRLSLGRVEQGAQGLCRPASGERRILVNLVAKAFRESHETFHLQLVRLAMDTVDEGLGVLACKSVHLAVSGHELSHSPVGQKHELLHEPVGLFGYLLVNIDRASLLVHLDLHLRAVEVYGTGPAGLGLELERQLVERLHRLHESISRRIAVSLDVLLSLLVGEAAVGADDGTSNPA